MSEKFIPRLEQAEETHETVDKHTAEHLHSHKKELAEHAKHEKSQENIAKIRELAKAHAEQSKQVEVETTTDEDDSMVGMQHGLKANAYERTLALTRQRLSKASRAFSVVSHNPLIEKVSDIGAQTVARPSGILGGSVFAFTGSVVFIYYSKHYGFTYNYLILFLLFAAGFAVGATAELLAWIVSGRKKRGY